MKPEVIELDLSTMFVSAAIIKIIWYYLLMSSSSVIQTVVRPRHTIHPSIIQFTTAGREG